MNVLKFPERARDEDPVVYPDRSAIILILPVVRVDRDDGTPAPHRQRRLRGKTADACIVDDMVCDGE